MPTKKSKYYSKLVSYLMGASCYQNEDFTLIDVGASGGIDTIWKQFEPHLEAIGFDPLIAEVERLNKLCDNSKVNYFDAWIGCKDKNVLEGIAGEGYWNNTSFMHTSAARAVEKMKIDYQQEFFNDGEEVEFTSNKISIDDYCHENKNLEADFLKIDTDGSDYFVLKGAETLLNSGSLLGLEVEVQFHGNTHPHSNLFSNIDLLLRSKGFTLFDLDIWRYSKGVLPSKFYYNIPAQTNNGQVQWGEAIYLLSPGEDEVLLSKMIDANNPVKFVSLMALYEIFGQAGSIAQLVLALQKRDYNIEGLDYKKILDLIVPKNEWGITNYQLYIDKFDSDPTLFYST